MPRFAFWILLLAVTTTVAQTNQQSFCCRYPIRAFGAVNVNLTPLFSWWSQAQARTAARYPEDLSRPLTAWKRILGTKTADLGYQWIVEAEIFTNRTHSIKTHIILQNPPAQEEQVYYALKQQIAGYDTQITNAQHAYESDLKAEQRARDRANADARQWSWRARLNGDAYARQSTEKHELANQAQTEETQAKQSLETMQKQLLAIPNTHGHYQIDCFAIDTGKVFKNLPVYDVGLIYIPTP